MSDKVRDAITTPRRVSTLAIIGVLAIAAWLILILFGLGIFGLAGLLA